MVTPSKFGDINLIGLNTYPTSSTSSTKNEMLSAGINLATSIGGLLLAGMVSRRSAEGADGGGDAAAAPQQTAEQQAKAALNNIDIQLAEVNGQISYLEGECTSQEDIDAKEQSIKNLEAEVKNAITTSDGSTITKEQVSKYIEANNNYNSAKTGLDTANTNVTNATTQRNALKQELESIDESCGTEEEVKTAKKTKQKELDAAQNKLDTAIAEQQKADQLFKEAQKVLKEVGVTVNQDNTIVKTDWQKSIDAKLDKIETEKAELSEMKATMKSNKKSLDTLYAKRAQLEQERAGAQAVYDKMVTESVVANVKKNQQINAAGADYTAADQKDGKNWWKRNMPSWLGGSSKAERKEMKEQHKLKDAAAERFEALGGSKDQLKEMQQANISSQVENYLSGRQSNEKITKAVTDAIKNGKSVDNAYQHAFMETVEKQAEAVTNSLSKNIYDSKIIPDDKKSDALKQLKQKLKIDFAKDINLVVSVKETIEAIEAQYK